VPIVSEYNLLEAKMFQKVIICLLVILSVSAMSNLQIVKAESYQLEGGGYYSLEKTDNSDFTLFGLGASWFFNEVSMEVGPYAEADFIQKAGSISLKGLMGNYESDESDGEMECDSYMIDAGLKYVFPVVPVFVTIGYELFNMDGDFVLTDFNTDMDIEIMSSTYYGELGYYIIDNLAVSAEYQMEKEETEKGKIEVGGIEYASADKEKTDKSGIGCNFKYVAMIGTGMALNIEAAYKYTTSEPEEGDDLINNIYELSADYYIKPQYGIGALVRMNTGDDEEDAGNTYELSCSVFLTPNIALAGSFGMFKADDKDEAEDRKEFNFMVFGRI